VLSPELLRLAAQITAAPKDRELQKIFADALIEEGGEHAIRGELIQLELAGNQEPRVTELQDRLLQIREAAGLGFLSLGRAGLARTWGCPIEQLEKHAAVTFAEEPLLDSFDLHLTDKDADTQDVMRRLAAIPELARIRTLSITVVFSGPPGPAGLATLMASPYWPTLEGLSLMSNALDDDAAQMLADSASLSELWHLNLINNKIGPDGVAALARSPRFAKLRHLSLAGNPIGERGLAALAGARAMQLITLDVRACGVRTSQLDGIKARFPGIEFACDPPEAAPEEPAKPPPDDDPFSGGPFV
jgi:hypothetical protein